MVPKRGRLARLIDIRRLKEASRRQEYGLALRAEERAAAEAEARRDRLQSAQEETRGLLTGSTLDVTRLLRLQEEMRFRERLSDRSENQRRRDSAARERAESAYRDARRDSRSLEKLQERHAESAALLRKRAEQRVNDEAALRRFLNATERAGLPPQVDAER